MSYLFQGFKYGHVEPWGAFAREGESPTLSFHHAGHVLGSAGIRVTHEKESLFYTGDVCFHDQTLLPKADFDGLKADVLILETTRGNTETPEGFTRDKEAKRFLDAIRAGLDRNAGVLVPVFALGRTQEAVSYTHLTLPTKA